MSVAIENITLRLATMEDRETVFRWRNDPFILSHGSSRRAVEADEHAKWFAETVGGERRRMFIVLDRNEPIGQIRFDRESEQDCVVSVYLLQPFTGRGWGSQVIRMGCEAIFLAWNVDRVIACIRLDNPAARAAFLKAKFCEIADAGSCPPGHYSLTLSRFRRRGDSESGST